MNEISLSSIPSLFKRVRLDYERRFKKIFLMISYILERFGCIHVDALSLPTEFSFVRLTLRHYELILVLYCKYTYVCILKHTYVRTIYENKKQIIRKLFIRMYMIFSPAPLIS